MDGSVEASLNYISRAAPTGVLYEFQRSSSTLQFDPHVMRIADGRQATEDFSLDRHGFTLVHSPVVVDDYTDEAEIARCYFPAVEALVKRLTGAAEIILLGGVLRSEDPARQARDPARNPHVDFDETTVRGLIRLVKGDAADALLDRRFALINLWRPIRPVERTPLAVCEAGTVDRGDLVHGAIGRKPGEPDGLDLSGYNVAYNPDHRWVYFPLQQPDEVLVFKLCDADPAALQFTAHTAFDDPTSKPDAQPRESYEVRTIAVW